jgi:hypothetical protein
LHELLQHWNENEQPPPAATQLLPPPEDDPPPEEPPLEEPPLEELLEELLDDVPSVGLDVVHGFASGCIPLPSSSPSPCGPGEGCEGLSPPEALLLGDFSAPPPDEDDPHGVSSPPCPVDSDSEQAARPNAKTIEKANAVVPSLFLRFMGGVLLERRILRPAPPSIYLRIADPPLGVAAAVFCCHPVGLARNGEASSPRHSGLRPTRRRGPSRARRTRPCAWRSKPATVGRYRHRAFEIRTTSLRVTPSLYSSSMGRGSTGGWSLSEPS